ncbi:MAG: NADPH-protochlorophyllide oxidoreductase, partial [Synechococcus sp.]|nr:NADPH-protochlorophyllide oxidoreductase [Synechococcus sp.]
PTQPSKEACDSDKATKLWRLSNDLINSLLTPSN